MSVLSLENLQFKTFPEQQSIIKGLYLEVEKGDFIVVVGTNGAGKSTLFNLISGQLEASGGVIKVNGKEITRESEQQRARYFGRVFQEPKMGTAPRMTVLENLALSKRRGKRFRFRMPRLAQERSEYEKLVASTGNHLERHLDTPTGDLSGGQRQALSLLMATNTEPELLLLDEHTAALDPKTSETIMAFTQEHVAKNKLTCLMITHDLKDALKYGNRLVMLDAGEIVLDVKGQDKAELTQAELFTYYH